MMEVCEGCGVATDLDEFKTCENCGAVRCFDCWEGSKDEGNEICPVCKIYRIRIRVRI